MIQFMRGNLFDVRADILVNTVNCVGVMGKGVALEFKNRYPAMFFAYRAACARGDLRIGTIHVWHRDVWIINLPTKKDWRNTSEYECIEAGLIALRNYLREQSRAYSVAMPPPGCGNGGLDWARVKPMIEKTLGSLPNTIYVFEP